MENSSIKLTEQSTQDTVTQSDQKRLQNQLIRHVMENYTVVWLDPRVNQSNETIRRSSNALRSIVHNVDIYEDSNVCMKVLHQFEQEKVFLVVIDVVSQTFIPEVHNIQALDSIFIFSDDDESSIDQEFINTWSKVRGFYKNTSDLCKSVREAANICDQNSVSVSIVNTEKSTENPSTIQIDPTFMYTQLLKEILIEVNFDEPRAIQDLVTFSRARFSGNTSELEKIEKFEHGYRDHSPIWWYTYECAFLYRTLNRSLGFLELDTLLKLGFFIQHLHRHIIELHHEQQLKDLDAAKPFQVYRGQGLSKDAFEKLQNSMGSFMSFNNFLSTSLEKKVAMEFIERVRTKADKIPVLFVIDIDPRIMSSSTAPFAQIDQFSCFEAEKEILFSMNSVFRIGAIQEMVGSDRGLWRVSLTLTSSDSDAEFAALIVRMREENTGTTGWTRLGQLLIKLGKYDKAEELYDELIANPIDERWLAHYHYMLGLVKFAKGEYDTAITLYEKSLTIFENDSPPNYSDMASAYNNLGLVYWTTGNNPQALYYYEKALFLKQQLPSTDHLNLTSTYNNIGLVYFNMGHYNQALEFFGKAVDIQKAELPAYHPDLAKTYRCIAIVDDAIGNFTEALEYYDKIIDIQQKSLPSNHPNIATSYNSLGEVHRKMGDYTKALQYYEQSLSMKQISLSPEDPELASSYTNIGNVYLQMGEFLKALSAYEQALRIQEKYLPSHHPDFSASYLNIGNVYCCNGDNEKSIFYFKKSIEIQEQIDPPNYQDLLSCYYNLGTLYHNMNDNDAAVSAFEKCLAMAACFADANEFMLAFPYHGLGLAHQSRNDHQKALEFYQKAIELREKVLPMNHPDLASTYSGIGDVYRSLKQYEQSISFHQKALTIQETVVCNKLETATTYQYMAETLREMEKYPEALQFYEKAFDIRDTMSPKKNLDLAVTSHNLGLMHYYTKNNEMAVKYVKLAIEIVKEIFNNQHPYLHLYNKTLEMIEKEGIWM